MSFVTSGVKVGQRVRVSYEGRVNHVATRWIDVAVDEGDGSDPLILCIRPAFVEVLPEPLKLGDEVTPGVDPEPPDWTVVIHTPSAITCQRLHGVWVTAGGRWVPREWESMPSVPWRVVWLPGNPS